MLARQRDSDEQQFELPPSLNTFSLQRISFFSEIRSLRSVTPFFSKTPHFPLNQIKLPLQQSPSRLVHLNDLKAIGVVGVVLGVDVNVVVGVVVSIVGVVVVYHKFSRID